MIREIRKNIFSVGANDPKRKMFDALMKLEGGTTYNSYLLKGSEKTALIDTVDASMPDILLDNLAQLNVQQIDYVIANHAEQDHSGALPEVLKKFPSAKIVCTPKCKEFLLDFFALQESIFITVADGDNLSLGDMTLEFIHAPWVHWPETMVTYMHEEGILFSCDLFGSHYETDDLTAKDEGWLYDMARKYYAEIMMPYRMMVKKNIEKIRPLSISLIAPSHGPVHENPQQAFRWYSDWTSESTKNLAVIIYVSMHGSMRAMAEHTAQSLKKKGVEVLMYDLSEAEIGDIASHLVDASTIVVGSPCLVAEVHPHVANALYLINIIKPKAKFLAILGSYSWAERIAEEIKGMVRNLKAETLEPVIVKGHPKEEDYKKMDNLADLIASKHISLL